MSVIDEPRLVTQELVELAQVLELLRYAREAVLEPRLLAVLRDELALLLLDEIDALVTRRRHYGDVVTRVVRQRAMLTVHEIVVQVDELLHELRMEAHHAQHVVDLALLRLLHFGEDSRHLHTHEHIQSINTS